MEKWLANSRRESGNGNGCCFQTGVDPAMEMDVEHMSRDARMWRIGHILSKGISLMLAKEMEEREALARNALATQFGENNREGQTTNLCDDSKAILDYLRRVGPASPTNIWRYTGISRTTVFRRLKELTKVGLLQKTGRDKSVQYMTIGFGNNDPKPDNPSAINDGKSDSGISAVDGSVEMQDFTLNKR
ncbi:MAG: helix-turn-helix domain-containing protein [Kiritimatiellae bacterium]|nr:helix-turn-helix domain-containing protein [Kiritimatiellia bacterium]